MDLFSNRRDEPPPQEGVGEVTEPVAEDRGATPETSVVKGKIRGRKPAAASAPASAPEPRGGLESRTSKAIQSIHSGTVIAGPAPSGASYVWESPGVVVDVAAEDVDWVMAKNGSKGHDCCGSGGPPVYFQMAD